MLCENTDGTNTPIALANNKIINRLTLSAICNQTAISLKNFINMYYEFLNILK